MAVTTAPSVRAGPCDARESEMSDGVAIRLATEQDAGIVARHRAAMFLDMGTLPLEQGPPLERAAEAYFRRAIPAGGYVGWLATPAGRPGEIVGGRRLYERLGFRQTNEMRYEERP